ncbi:rhomboid family intramembrane serine protease [Wenyingzhuangia sp. IMCC45574]
MNFLVLLIIGANVAASLKGFKDRIFFDKYKFNVLAIQKGDQQRMFWSGFLHVDPIHLGFNMYALYLFSNQLLYGFSDLQFIGVYCFSLLAGSALTLVVHKKEPYYNAVGASGAVMGIMYASFVMFPDKEYSFMFFPFIEIKGYLLGIGYLFYSIYGMKKQLGNIGHTAHLGGAIAGYILTILMKPQVFQYQPYKVLFLAIPIVVLWVLHKKNILSQL